MRIIIVHTLEHASAALEAASDLQVSVVLQSPPDAIFYAGSLYLLHLFQHACAMYPNVNATCILDCSDASGEAAAAIQLGHGHIRSSAPEETREKLLGIAAECGVTVHDGVYEALDLAYARDAKAASLKWLKND